MMASSTGRSALAPLPRDGITLDELLAGASTTEGRWIRARLRAYLERTMAEGKSRREALRCLERHLARVVFNTLREMKSHPASQP